MKGTVGCILRIVAAVMAAAALICAVVAFWDEIMDLIDAIVDRVEEKQADRCFEPAEFDDFADYDDSIM